MPGPSLRDVRNIGEEESNVESSSCRVICSGVKATYPLLRHPRLHLITGDSLALKRTSVLIRGGRHHWQTMPHLEQNLPDWSIGQYFCLPTLSTLATNQRPAGIRGSEEQASFCDTPSSTSTGTNTEFAAVGRDDELRHGGHSSGPCRQLASHDMSDEGASDLCGLVRTMSAYLTYSEYPR